MLRTSLRPGLFKALAYNASHRNDDVGAVRDRPHLPAGEPAAARRARGAGGGAGRPGGSGDRARGAGGGRRARARRPAGGAPASCPCGAGRACTLVAAPSCWPTGPRSAWWARSTPASLEAYGIPGRVAWLELDLSALLDLEPADRAMAAREPVPVERHRPGLRRPPTTSPRRTSSGAIAPAAGELLADLELFDVYRGPGHRGRPSQPGLPPSPAGARPHAHRRRGGRPSAPAPSPPSAEASAPTLRA